MFKNIQTKKMNNRTNFELSALILLLTVSAFAALPASIAHTPAWTTESHTYVTVSPNPVGVHQLVSVVVWLNLYPATATGKYGDRWTFNVEVTKPDGSKETIGPLTSDPVGGAYTLYTPNQVGTYDFQAIFPGHTYTGQPFPPSRSSYVYGNEPDYVNDTILPSKSALISLNVTENQVQPWSETPLPTEYWTRPINDMNRDWSEVAGNWLGGAAQNVNATSSFGYGAGPESAHVMWTKPYMAGGLMDARYDDAGYYAGNPYEYFGLSPPIIINGVLYYNVQYPPIYGWYAVDLQTGETLYFHNTTGPVALTSNQQHTTPLSMDPEGSILGESLAFGQIFNYNSPNQHGGLAYLWSKNSPAQPNTWMMFDAFAGNYICSLANVSAVGTNLYGKDGSILYYNIVGSGANKRLTVWNTTEAIHYRDSYWGNHYWTWRPYLNYTFGGQYGFSLNVSIPNVQGGIRTVREDQYVIGGVAGLNNENGIIQGNLWALSLKAGQEGTLLWNITFTPPFSAGNETVAMSTMDPENGVFLFSVKETMQWYGYSLTTGKLLWGPTDSQDPWMYYGMVANIYQNMLITYGWSGTVYSGGEIHAYDITSGKTLWTYFSGSPGYETVYDNVPIGVALIADGKLYATSSEHSPSQPLWRGSYLRCINASNGQELWKISLWASPGTAISDGYITTLNTYDGQIYCLGKGPSATSVTVSPKISTKGNAVLIEGAVFDISAGTKQTEQAGRFPDGVPAVSDASMSAWMEYLYEQQPKPNKATGVKVHLTAFDPNNNTEDLGYTTSDASGNYALPWTPPVPGVYKITATFEGSNSYYSSSAETALSATTAPSAQASTPAPTQTAEPTSSPVQTNSPSTSPSPSPTPSPAVQPPTSGTSTTTYIAIAAAVIIIAVVAAAVALRRRK